MLMKVYVSRPHYKMQQARRKNSLKSPCKVEYEVEPDLEACTASRRCTASCSVCTLPLNPEEIAAQTTQVLASNRLFSLGLAWDWPRSDGI